MISRRHDYRLLVLNKIKMAAVSITSLASYLADKMKLLQLGENHFKSGHVERCDYLPGVLSGVVRASMKDKTYIVTVSVRVVSDDSDKLGKI